MVGDEGVGKVSLTHRYPPFHTPNRSNDGFSIRTVVSYFTIYAPGTAEGIQTYGVSSTREPPKNSV